MPLSTGLLLKDRYRIVSLIAQGGMGAVYKAWDLSLKMPVAIKENLDSSLAAQAQFEREALILARISHPNLPRVIDHFSLPGHGQFLVMDFVEGEDLEEMFETSGSANLPSSPAASSQPGQSRSHPSASQVIPWTIQVCDALDYLHSQNPPIVHRDIKPANIKIRPDGQAMLVDFGIAKTYDPQFSTLTGARAVTAGYSPPEQYGGGKTDPRSDIYALGATLYHLLTGEKPPESVQRMAGSVKTPSPRQLNPQISPAVESALLKAMAVPIERRYQNIGEFRLALAQSIHPKPITPALQPLPYPPVLSSQQSAPVSSSPAGLPYPVNWPLYMLGGIGLIVILLIVGRLILSRQPGSTPPSDQASQGTLDASSSLPQATTQGATFPALIPSATLSPAPPTPQISTGAQGTPTLPVWPVTMLDSFDLNRHRWPAEIGGGLQCIIVQGRYLCETPPNSASHYWLVLEQVTLDDGFYLAMDVRMVEGPKNAQAGLIFRDNPNGCYLFSLRADGYFRISLVQKRLTNWVNLVNWTPSTAIHSDLVNRLAVSGNGAQYAFFINGELVAEIVDNQWKDGSPGIHLFSATLDSPTVFEFDNFEIRNGKKQ